MTREELNEKINILAHISGDKVEGHLRDLLRDVIAAVTPEKEIEQAPSRLIHTGYNMAIDTIQRNTKELLG